MSGNGILYKTAFGVFLIGTGGLYFAHRYIQKKVRAYPHYKETLEILASHEEAQRVLGVPIKVGKIDISDRKRNYVGNLESKFRVPISGTLCGGYLNIAASRDDELADFETQTVELELDSVDEEAGNNNETYLIYDRVEPMAESQEAPSSSLTRHPIVRFARWLLDYRDVNEVVVSPQQQQPQKVS